jgi:hypothetical protein
MKTQDTPKATFPKALILLSITFVFCLNANTSYAYNQPKSTSLVAISKYLLSQQNSEISDKDKIKSTINAYFTVRYEGQRLLKTQDFAILIEDNTMDWVKSEQDKREIELYIARLFDLKYVKYQFTIDFDSIELEQKKAEVWLRESHEVVFESLSPDVSVLSDLQHKITLHNKKGLWKIYKDEYYDEIAKQMKHLSKDKIMEQIDQNFKNEQKVRKATEGNSLITPYALTTYTYNRLAAVSYANTYTSSTTGSTKYNQAWYQTETNDCANYVSQSLYAGEGKSPPDTSGMTNASGRSYYTDWYYVFNNPQGTQNGSGSLPWVRVQEQYDFIIGNTNKIGPYGWGGENYLCYVKKGDVVQLYGVNSPNIWDHEGFIVSASGPCTSLSNYKVNAHTINRYQYPLSNWANFPMRYILISGWRGS